MLTHAKDLRTGHPVWLTYASPRISVDTLTSDKSTDVVVIGAGITGAMIAQSLTEAGFSVIILDRRGPLKGSTAATTALLQAEIDTPLIHLSDKIGRRNAERAWRRSKLGLESLAAALQSLKIRCDMERHSSLYLSGNMLSCPELQEEREARAAIGLPCEWVNRKTLLETYGIWRSGALKTYGSIAVNPRTMAAGFLQHALEHGARIYAPVTADGIEQGGGWVHVETSEGPVISAAHVVFATGYEIPKAIQTRRHKIHSTWAIATKKQPRKLWPEASFIWEASDPYLYVRTAPDGRVICGGEDEPFSDEEARDALIVEKTAMLEKKLAALLPQIDAHAEFTWTGSFGSSTTGLPSIGVVPGMKNTLAVMAFGGNGITYGRIAAEMIRSLLTGKQDPEADLFAFT